MGEARRCNDIAAGRPRSFKPRRGFAVEARSGQVVQQARRIQARKRHWAAPAKPGGSSAWRRVIPFVQLLSLRNTGLE
jgi:hypothetical protein